MKLLKALAMAAAAVWSTGVVGMTVNGTNVSGGGNLSTMGWAYASGVIKVAWEGPFGEFGYVIDSQDGVSISRLGVGVHGGLTYQPTAFSVSIRNGIFTESFGMNRLDSNVFARVALKISGGDFRKCMQTTPQRDGIDMVVARGQMLIAARAAGIQCFDTVFTDLNDMEGFRRETLQNKQMGFDGKSLINPKQVRPVHEILAPTEKEIMQAEKIVAAYAEHAASGVGVFTIDGKMIDIAFVPGAVQTLKKAKASELYEGDLV